MTPEDAAYWVTRVWDAPDDWGDAFEALLGFDDTKYEPCEGRVRAWILRRLRAVAIDRHRKRTVRLKRHEHLAVLDTARRKHSERDLPSESEIGRVVKFCEEKGLDMLLDYARSGMTLKDYSEAKGIPIGTLKSRLHRERKMVETIRDAC